jgi:DNA-binding IclR family transcriptional regulator
VLVENQVVVLKVLQGNAIVNFGTQPGTVLELHAGAHGILVPAFGPPDLTKTCLAKRLRPGLSTPSAPRMDFNA